MNKPLIILFTSFLQGTLFGQSFILEKDFQWSQHEKHILTQEKRDRIEQVKEEVISAEGYAAFYESNPQTFQDNFHLIDLDRDGMLDLVFEGFVGAESTFLLAFQQTSNGYKKVFSAVGRVHKFIATDPLLPYTIVVYNYGCCADITNYYRVYTPDAATGLLKYQETATIGCIDDVTTPTALLEKPIPFKVKNNHYLLRNAPAIDDAYEYSEDPDFPGNSIAAFGAGATGLALAEQTDETGRVWWFVLMDSKYTPSKSLFYNKEPGLSILGWMSSRYLEKSTEIQ